MAALAASSLFGEIDDFDKYPIIGCEFKNKSETDWRKIQKRAETFGVTMTRREATATLEKSKSDTNTNYSSGVRGDGDCSIWAVLIGWSLFNRQNLFMNHPVSNPQTIDKVKATLIEVIGNIISVAGGNDEFPLNEYDTVLKSELSNLKEQLEQNFNERNTIDGSSHFAILAMLMGVNIKVRYTISSPNTVRSYGNKSFDTIRITTNGVHYNVHHNRQNFNGDLSSLSKKHWWREQWKGSSDRKECKAVIQPNSTRGESKQEYKKRGQDKATSKQETLMKQTLMKQKLTSDLQSMVNIGTITREQAISMMGKKKKTKAKKKKTKAKKKKANKKKGTKAKKKKAKKAKKGGTRKKRRKNAKKKNCHSLGSNMLCHRGSRKKLKKLKKLTKKLKLRMTRCSRRRMNKWK